MERIWSAMTSDELIERVRQQPEAVEEAMHDLARYADLYDFAPVALCSLDEHGRVEEANLTFCALFAVDRVRIIGKPFTAVVNLDEPRAFRQQLRSCLTDGGGLDVELTVRVHGLAATILRMTGGAVPQPDGARWCRVAFVDVSDEKRQQKKQKLMASVATQLASSFDYNATVADAVRQAVPLIADVCFVDVLEGSGLSRVEVAFADPQKRALSSKVRHFLPDADAPNPQREVLRSGQPILLTEPQADLLGDYPLASAVRPSSAILLPLVARARTIGVLTLIMVESGRKYTNSDVAFAHELSSRIALAVDNGQLYQAAKKAVATREEILSIVSHDLKTPLSSILLNADLLLRGAPDSERRRGRRSIESIRRSASRMSRMVDDLLDLSSIDAQRLSLDRSAHDVAFLLKDAREVMLPLAREKSIELSTMPPPESALVICDRERVMQVFSNLIGNAVKFTPDHGSVRIRAEPRDGEVLFSITDTGPGIEGAELEHVFERYWRTQGPAGGRGLGLCISKGIVEMLGGVIGVASTVGEGTTFTFTLPAFRKVGAAAPPPAREDTSERARFADSKPRDVERSFRLLVDGIRDFGIAMFDGDGRVVSWNTGAERLLGWRADEVVGEHYSITSASESSAEECRAELESAAARGRVQRTTTLVHKDGSSVKTDLVIHAMFDEAEHLIGFACVARALPDQASDDELPDARRSPLSTTEA